MNAQQAFCPNPCCPSRAETGQGNIVVHSWTQRRYRCQACGKTVAASRGTAFFRLRYEDEFVAQVLRLLAFGCPAAAVVVAFGLDARTVAAWQRKAGQHCQSVHQGQVLDCTMDLGQVQADEVRVKRQGRQVLWMAMALAVPFRLWLGGVVSARRDRHLIEALAKMVHSCARFAPILLVSDGLKAYVRAWKKAFRTALHTGRRGRPALVAWPEVVIGQSDRAGGEGQAKEAAGAGGGSGAECGAGKPGAGAQAAAREAGAEHGLHRTTQRHLPRSSVLAGAKRQVAGAQGRHALWRACSWWAVSTTSARPIRAWRERRPPWPRG